MKLKQLSIFAVGVVVAAMIAGPSTAFGAFTLHDYNITANTSGPGLEVETAKLLSADS